MPMPSLLPFTAFCNNEDNFMMHVELYVLDIIVHSKFERTLSVMIQQTGSNEAIN